MCLRACANRRVAYVSTGDAKAMQSPGESPAVGWHLPMGEDSNFHANGYTVRLRLVADEEDSGNGLCALPVVC